MGGAVVFRAGLIGVVTLGLACDGGSLSRDGGAPAGDGGGTCPRCPEAGGSPAPTRCQLSETATQIDEQAARALGFGDGLDLLTRDEEIPFQWTALETSVGDPAQGYTPTTSVHLRTTVASVMHFVPSLAGCKDALGVTLPTSLSTGDGALAIDGELSSVFERDEPAPWADASLDLATSHGALTTFPARSDVALVSYVLMAIRFWPAGTRGNLSVETAKAAERYSDFHTYSYRPLQGRWPIVD